jgi:carboxymethylenebutenolidase
MGQDIELEAADGGRFEAYFCAPQGVTNAPGLIVLPEVFNTNHHIREVADGYAADGFAVLSPDVYWRQERGCFLPYTDDGRAKARALRELLDTDQFCKDLADMVAALAARPECNGQVGLMGFCLGGKFAYLAATRTNVRAAVSYYGVEIDAYLDEAASLQCPLLMHFASDDPHVPPSAVEAIRARLEGNDRVDIRQYPGTEHGFNRFGYPSHHAQAAETARERTLAHFRANLTGS